MAPPHTVDWLGMGSWDRAHLRHTEERHGLWQQIRLEVSAVLLRDKMNLLLLLLPLALVSHAVKWPAGATFVLSLLPLCSLAERLGMITEQLAMYTNDTIGGVCCATFGNATEVIIAAFAIKKGYLRVVKLTLLGSIISNLLLVMGSAFVAGGLFHPCQSFNQQGIAVNCGLLILAVVAVMLPTLLSSTAEVVKDFGAELALSRFESVLMLCCYGLFLVFQLVTHRHLYEGGGSDGGAAPAKLPPALAEGTSCAQEDDDIEQPLAGARQQQQQQQQQHSPHRHQGLTEVELGAVAAPGGGLTNGTALLPTSSGISAGQLASRRASTPGRDAAAAAAAGGAAEAGGEDGDRVRLVGQQQSSAAAAPVQVVEEEEDEQVLSWPGCFIWLAAVTVLISVLSDYIMDAITEASTQLKVPMPFLTTIVVPIVGNAAEHASALIFAVKNRMEVALGVAMGSSTQVGVLVVPFCVVLAWAMGQPLDLNFNEFEALVLFISVLLAIVVVQDGTSNWLKGAMLVLTYLFISAGFWVHKDPSLKTSID